MTDILLITGKCIRTNKSAEELFEFINDAEFQSQGVKFLKLDDSFCVPEYLVSVPIKTTLIFVNINHIQLIEELNE